MRRLWLVCYDISDDKLRRKIASELENAGFRCQYSVFEARLEQAQQTQIQRKLARLILGQDASIRWYPLCKWCRQQAEHLGKPAYEREGEQIDDGFFII